jgi:preprotein translocase subunit YajC
VDSVGQLVPFVLIIFAFYLLIIRPSRKRASAQQRLGEQLTVGARVMTTSGLFAEVVAVEDDGVLLSPAPGVTMKWTKAAVSRILPEPDVEDEPDLDDETAERKTDAEDDVPDVSDVAADSDSTDRTP